MEPEGSLPCSLVPVLNQINPAHAFPCFFRKIHSNIMLLRWEGKIKVNDSKGSKYMHKILFRPSITAAPKMK